jgi:5-methylcytosine-specific restriction protein A
MPARRRSFSPHRACITPGCRGKIPILADRKTPSRCNQCRGSSWSNPPPANLYAYGGSWQVIRKQVLVRDGYRCQLHYADICVGRASQVDHIIQPEAGGGNDLANLRAVCVPCHARRTGRQGALAKQRRAAAKKRRI